MNLKTDTTHKFEKHFKELITSKKKEGNPDKVRRRAEQNVSDFKEAMSYLENRERLPNKFSDHQLDHQDRGVRDFHIEDDRVVVYYIIKNQKILLLDIGKHKKVFHGKQPLLNHAIKERFDIK